MKNDETRKVLESAKYDYHTKEKTEYLETQKLELKKMYERFIEMQECGFVINDLQLKLEELMNKQVEEENF